MRQGTFGENVPSQGCRSGSLANKPVENEAVEQCGGVRNSVNRVPAKMQNRDFVTAGKRGENGSCERAGIGTSGYFAISDLFPGQISTLQSGDNLDHQKLRIPSEVTEVVTVSPRSRSGSAQPPSRTRDKGPDHDSLIHRKAISQMRATRPCRCPSKRIRRYDGHLGAGSKLLPGWTIARDLDVIFAFSGAGNIEGSLHSHERVHPDAECFLDT